MIVRVVSGGQAGADRAALEAATALGLPYGGWCPLGGRAEDLPDPPGVLALFPQLSETPTTEPSVRTAWNVRDSDATLVLRWGEGESAGTDLTTRVADELGRPLLVARADDVDAVVGWLRTLGDGLILNVAGPRESEAPGLRSRALRTLVAALGDVCGRTVPVTHGVMTDATGGLEPIPETREAISSLEQATDERGLLQGLLEQSRRVREVVPDCVGLSVALLDHGVSFTLVATSEDVARLDGVQYLVGGPCVGAVAAEQALEFAREDLLDEGAWQAFASATAAAGIGSTLTLPILVDARVIGTVNLYAASEGAFRGHHRELAEIFSAWVPGAVSNADLSFRTRRVAQTAPDQVQRRRTIDTALGILAVVKGVSIEGARADLQEAARRAGVDELDLAGALIEIGTGRDPDGGSGAGDDVAGPGPE